MKVLVCDDLPEGELNFVKAIEDADVDGVATERLHGETLKAQLHELIEAADEILTNGGCSKDLPKTRFDEDFDLVVLDNNLAHLGIRGARLTAEEIAGYVRAFSSAPYIVSVNKNPDVDFDLRYLIGDYATRADLAVNTDHLSNPALWTGERKDAKDGFRPWYWPRLLEAGAKRREQIAFVRKRLDERVSGAVGFSEEDFGHLSRQARSLPSLAEKAERNGRPEGDSSGFDATFRGVFLASNRSLPNRDERDRLLGNAALEKTVVPRVTAADIDLWFRRDVFGPQEVTVDVPHLLMRMPFLLGKDAGDRTRWNAAADAAMHGKEPFGLDPGLYDKHLKPVRLDEQSVWAPSPCFLWPTLRENDELNALFSAEDPGWAEVVFCEDVSEFRPFEPDDGASSPREFVAQFEGSWNRRYVQHVEGKGYTPRTRFAQ